MTADPATDIDQGNDIQNNAYAPTPTPTQQDLADRQDQLLTPSGPGVYTPTYTGGGIPMPAPTPPPTTTPAPSARAQSRFVPMDELRTWQRGPTYEMAAPIQEQPQEQAPKEKGWLHDTAAIAWNSVRSTAGDLIGLGQAINDQTLNSPAVRDTLTSASEGLQSDINKSLNSLSPRMKTATNASLLRAFGIGPDTDEQGNHIPSPGEAGWGNYFSARVAENLPMAAALLFAPEGLIGKLVVSGVMGATNAGQTYNQISKSIEDEPDAKFQAENPTYKAMRQSGLSEQDAKLKALQGTWVSVLGAAGVGAAAGAGLGATMGRGAAAATGGSWIARRLLGAAEGAVPMAVQQGGDEAIYQATRVALGQQDTVDMDRIARETASGAIGGAALGAALGGRAREAPAREEQPQGEQRTRTGDPAVDAALGEEFGPPASYGPQHPGQYGPFPQQGPPVEPAGPPRAPTIPPRTPGEVSTSQPAGFVPGSSQAEMFQPHEMGQGPAPGAGMPAGARQGEMFPNVGAAPGGGAGSTAPLPTPGQGGGMGEGGGTAVPPTRGEPAPEGRVQGEMFPAAGEAPAPAPTPVQTQAPLTRGQVAPKDWPSYDMTTEAMRDELATRFGINVKGGPNSVSAAYDNAVWREQARQPAGQTTEPATTEVTREAAPTPGEAQPAPVPPVEPAAAVPTGVGETALPAGTRTPAPAGEPAPVAEPAVAPEAAASVREQALEHLAQVTRGVEKLPRKEPNAVIIRKAMAEMQRAFDAAGSQDDILAHLRTMQSARAGETNQEYVIRRNLAAAVEARLTGERATFEKTLEARKAEQAARETAETPVQEVQREEEQRGGAEPRSPEAIEREATGAGEGGQTMGLEPVQARVRKTTDMKVVGRQLLAKVLDSSDPMTLAEARDRFERRGLGGAAGRPRRAETQDFASVVESELKRVDTPGKKALLESQLRNALINGDDELSQRLEKTLEDYAPERVNQLRDMLGELRDPVGKATREGEIESEHRPQGASLAPTAPDGIDPRSSRFVQASRDPRLNANLVRAMRASEEHGVPFTLQDALRLIQHDSLVNAEARPFRALATQILRMLGREDLPVYSGERAGDLGLRPAPGYGASRMYPRAPERNHIIVNIGAEHEHGTHVGTLLHEAMHVITSRYLHELRLREPNHPDLQALQAIQFELANHLRGSDAFGTERENLQYATSSLDELHTMLMTDPTVQAFAASRTASPDLLRTLRALGMPSGQPGRSVWRVFTDWVRRALGMQAPASASEYTLLDHVLRPTQDIAERAAAYNRRLLPKDPVLRGPAEQMSDGFSHAFSPRDVAERMLERADLPGLGDRARAALLSSATSDGIVHRYEGILKNLPGWRAAQEAIAATAKRFVNANYDDTQALIRRYNRSDNPQELGRLMTDTTLAGARLGPGADNTHLTTPAQRSALQDLQARFARLSPSDQNIYTDMRDRYAQWRNETRPAQLNYWIDNFMPDATAAQRAELHRLSENREGLQRYIADQGNAPTARNIARLQLTGQVQGDYFPLRRSGKYVVTYGDRQDPGSYGVEFFDRRTEAEARKRDLAADPNPPADIQFGLKRNYETQALAPQHPFIAELMGRLADRGYDARQRQEVQDLLNSTLLAHATSAEQSRASSTMRRRGVKGAMTDHAKVLANEFLATQGRLGYLEHGGERSQALAGLREEARLLGRTDQGVKAEQVVQEVEKRSASIDDIDNPIQKLAAKASMLSFAQSLMSPSHMLTSSMEAHTNSLALLGAKYGYARASIALSRALLATSPALKEGAMNTVRAVRGELKQNNWNILNVLRDRLVANGAHRQGMDLMLTRLEDAGLVDHTVLQDMRMMANPAGVAGGRAAQLWNWFYNMNAASAHSVDAMNKLAIAKAAFDLHLKQTGNWREAVNAGVEMARWAMPNYNVANKGRLATQRGILGPFGAPLMQFKNYGLHMYTIMANLAHDAMSSARTPEERWVAAKGLAGLLATHAMMAGVITLIADPLRYVGGLYDLLTGEAKPHNYENNVRAFMAETFGKELGEVISRGLPHLAGIDVHRRVGLANLLEIPEMTEFGKSGAGQVLLGLATGATGENLQTEFDGVTKLMSGDLSGLEGLVPRPIRDAMKAAGLSSQGVTDRTGETILAPEKVGPGGVAAQALGFQPSVVSEFREGRNAALETREELRSAHTQLVNQFLAAAPIDRYAVLSRIREFNQDPAHRGFTIDPNQLHRDLQQRAKDARGPFGLRVPRKAMQTVSQAGSFANVP